MASNSVPQEDVSLSPPHDRGHLPSVSTSVSEISSPPHMGSPLGQHSGVSLMENVRVEKISFGREAETVIETGKATLVSFIILL